MSVEVAVSALCYWQWKDVLLYFLNMSALYLLPLLDLLFPRSAQMIYMKHYVILSKY